MDLTESYFYLYAIPNYSNYGIDFEYSTTCCLTKYLYNNDDYYLDFNFVKGKVLLSEFIVNILTNKISVYRKSYYSTFSSHSTIKNKSIISLFSAIKGNEVDYDILYNGLSNVDCICEYKNANMFSEFINKMESGYFNNLLKDLNLNILHISSESDHLMYKIIWNI